MKILYDLIFLEKEECGGISRMWAEYFKKICKEGVNISFIGNYDTSNTTSSLLKKLNYCNGSIIDRPKSPIRILSKIFKLNIVNSIFLLGKVNRKVDIFHSTGYSNPLFKPKGVKIVTTIHDMVFWDQKDVMKKDVGYWDYIWGIYHSLKISDRIVTVSEASRRSIIKHYPWAEDKIDVIYHGLAEEFLDVDIKKEKERYFMFIGSRNEYKNYDLLLKSFALFIKERPEWKLCVVGQNNHTIEIENEKYRELGISGNVNDYGLVDQDVMINFIQNASAVVIPSLNEGFNFPLLEAMACGAPVLCSNIPVSLEIGKEYVEYFNNDEQSLFRLMKKSVESKIGYDKLKEAKEYASTFNWNKSYRDLMKVYNSCV